jgi:NADH-quinone oxidoreductase subunit C
MTSKEIFDVLKETFGDDIIDFKEEAPSDPFITINSLKIFDVCLFLRDDVRMKFDYLSLLGGMDLKDKLGVVYHLYSIELKHSIVLKVELDREQPKVASVERIWRAADWHEREAYDMFGIIFEGHHNLIRILCAYDWEGYPLRKDYVTPEFYHGIPVPY